MRCPRCGNENPGTNRFCGMCGATLLPAPAAVATQSQGSPSPTAQLPRAPVPASAAPPSATSAPAIPSQPAPTLVQQNTTAPRAAAPVREERPVISGPSFLGLNDPPPRKRASLSIDPQSLDPQSTPSAGHLDYLLEDEEPPKRGAGKFILIVVVLALVGGVGYLRWKNQGFGWLSSGTSKPAAATQPSDSADSTPSDSPSATSPTPAAEPASGQPATDAAPAASSRGASAAPDKSASSTTPGADAIGSDNAAGDTPVNTSNNTPNNASSPATSHPPAARSADSADPNLPLATTARPRPPNPSAPAPVAKPAKAFDPVSEAQKYLYGKGVRQDCDHGLHLLKPAADRANPKAMIEMGALYSAGLCTPRDLPTAYRWFAMALRKDPDNQSVQTDLQKLWGEMTQPERQLAIKLSQ